MNDNNHQQTALSSSQAQDVALETQKLPTISKRVFHVKDDTERKPGRFDWAEKIWIPLLTAVMGIWIGWKLTSFQEANAEANRLVERASAASNNRQAVLTNYASRMTDLIATQGAMDTGNSNSEGISIWNAIRGETIIALKRLDDTRQDDRSESDFLEQSMRNALNLPGESASDNGTDENRQLAELSGFDDSGKLKGELVRFLYEAQLLDGRNSAVSEVGLLGGADLVRVILNGAPMPEANFKRAWMRQGQFVEANLTRSDLRGAELSKANFQNATLSGANIGWANLQKANLMGADLSFANLESADIRGADLSKITITSNTVFTNACFDSATIGLDNFNTERLRMRDASDDPLDTQCSDL